MKVFIVLATFAAVASASLSHGGLSLGGGIEQGQSTQFREDDDAGNYRFGYDETHSSGGTSRREEETNGVRRGSYSLMDADGRRRTVSYIADASGFHAQVSSNEPGVDSKDSADVQVNAGNGNGNGCGLGGCGGELVQAPAPINGCGPNGCGDNGAWNGHNGAWDGHNGAWNGNTWTGSALAAAPRAQHSYAAPAARLAPAPLRPQIYSAPAPVLRQQTYAAPVLRQQTYAAPAPILNSYAAPQQQQIIEAPTPRAFRYSFGSAHASPVRLGGGYNQAAPVQQQWEQAPVRAY